MRALAIFLSCLLSSCAMLSHDRVYRFPDPVRGVHVTTEYGDVQVSATDSRIITVSARVSCLRHRKPALAIAVKEGILWVGLDKRFSRSEADFRIEVPRSMQPDFRIHTQTGDVTIDGLAGSLAVVTESGFVSGTARSAEVSVTSDSGDVQLQLASTTRSFRAGSDSGDIDLLVSQDEADVQHETRSGATRLRSVKHREGADVLVRVATGSGSLRVRRSKPVESGKKG